jgi:hypothetical protein
VPLTRQPRGAHAWKELLLPIAAAHRIPLDELVGAPEIGEWLYVLDGELRLIIADHDIIMGPGEVAEFDTQVPHWLGSADDRPVEILSILGREGERIHVPAAARRRNGSE